MRKAVNNMNESNTNKRKGRPKKEKINKKRSVFCNRLNVLFESKKESQESAALAVGTIRQTFGKWLSGETEPQIESIVKLAKYYNVSIDFLLGNDDVSKINISDKAVLNIIENNDFYEAQNALLSADHYNLLISAIGQYAQTNDNTTKMLYELAMYKELEYLRKEVIEKITGNKYE